MDARTRAELTQALRHRRAAILAQFFTDEDQLRSFAEHPEAELEQRAQDERAARVLVGLDDRSLRELGDIHAALQRVVDRVYGTCVGCGAGIPVARLRALPTTAYCVECARESEAAAAAPPEAPEATHPGRLPPDLESLLDREVEETLRELVAADDRLDHEELRIVCRHGVVHLAGAVPSEAEHEMVLKTVTDVAGCEDVADHLVVDPLAWERPDRSRPQPEERTRPSRREPLGTEDVVRSGEEGIDYVAPDRPPSDEEE